MANYISAETTATWTDAAAGDTITITGSTTSDSFTAGHLVNVSGGTFTDCTSFTTTASTGTSVYFKTRTNPETGMQEMVPQL